MELVGLIAPVFAVIATGYAFSWLGVFDEHMAEALVQYSVYVLIPILMFWLIGQEEFRNLLNVGFYAAFGGSLIVLFLGLFAVFRLVLDWPSGNVAMLTYLGVGSNTGLVALPVLHALFGSSGALPAVLANLVVALLLFSLTVLLERLKAGGARNGALMIARNTLMNPIILGTLLGILYSASGLGFAPAVNDYLQIFSQALAAVALFAIGFSTRLRALAKTGGFVAMLSLVKLVAAPALVLLAAHLVGLDPLWTVAAVVSAAVPTAKHAYLLASHYGRKPELAAHVISATSLLSIATLIGWLVLLHHLHPGAFSLN